MFMNKTKKKYSILSFKWKKEPRLTSIAKEIIDTFSREIKFKNLKKINLIWREHEFQGVYKREIKELTEIYNEIIDSFVGDKFNPNKLLLKLNDVVKELDSFVHNSFFMGNSYKKLEKELAKIYIFYSIGVIVKRECDKEGFQLEEETLNIWENGIFSWKYNEFFINLINSWFFREVYMNIEYDSFHSFEGFIRNQEHKVFELLMESKLGGWIKFQSSKIESIRRAIPYCYNFAINNNLNKWDSEQIIKENKHIEFIREAKYSSLSAPLEKKAKDYRRGDSKKMNQFLSSIYQYTKNNMNKLINNTEEDVIPNVHIVSPISEYRIKEAKRITEKDSKTRNEKEKKALKELISNSSLIKEDVIKDSFWEKEAEELFKRITRIYWTPSIPKARDLIQHFEKEMNDSKAECYWNYLVEKQARFAMKFLMYSLVWNISYKVKKWEKQEVTRFKNIITTNIFRFWYQYLDFLWIEKTIQGISEIHLVTIKFPWGTNRIHSFKIDLSKTPDGRNYKNKYINSFIKENVKNWLFTRKQFNEWADKVNKLCTYN